MCARFDKLVLTIPRSTGELRFGEVMRELGHPWQDSLQVCVEANSANSTLASPPTDLAATATRGEEGLTAEAEKAAGNDEWRGAVPSSMRNELASNLYFLTPAGYRIIGGRRTTSAGPENLPPPPLPASGLVSAPPPAKPDAGTVRFRLDDVDASFDSNITDGYNKVARI